MMRKKKIVLKGFTLVELIIVITILGSLLTLTVMLINPTAQLDKINDAHRRSDLQEIKTALDTYYNDHSCYPSSLSFGSVWDENGTVYMRKVPQDPNCASDPDSCYVYMTPGGACPQWNIVFSKLSKAPAASACQLSSLVGCTPASYDSSWACAGSGNYDCSYIATQDLASGAASPSTTPTPTSGALNPTATPTPTSTCSPRNYSCTGSPLRCNVVAPGTGQYCTSACGGAC